MCNELPEEWDSLRIYTNDHHHRHHHNYHHIIIIIIIIIIHNFLSIQFISIVPFSINFCISRNELPKEPDCYISGLSYLHRFSSFKSFPSIFLPSITFFIPCSHCVYHPSLFHDMQLAPGFTVLLNTREIQHLLNSPPLNLVSRSQS
jgi:hypothetical protein